MPNRSKWLIRNVETRTNPQPKANNPRSTSRPAGFSTDQITPPNGRHCQNNRMSARLEKSTYVERSTTLGTMRVHHSLNHLRAICVSAGFASHDALRECEFVIRKHSHRLINKSV